MADGGRVDPPLSPAGRPHPGRTPFRKSIVSARKRAERKCDKLAEELHACDAATEWLECGELIKAHPTLLKRGMTEAELPDLYHPGQTRCIELDPYLKPLANAKKYFKRYRKLVDGQEHIQSQLALCQQRLTDLQALQDAYAVWDAEAEVSAPPREDLVAQAQSLSIPLSDHVVPPAKPQGTRREAPAGVREFQTRDGLTVYVGKTARDNDRLSRQLARGNDWWFHVAHQQGSHVVVRTPHGSKKDDFARQALPQESLLDAAHLAVWFSKARRATRAEVTYTQAKNLRKAKGAPAGQVIVQNGSTLSLRVEQTRLDRLLERSEPLGAEE